MNNERELITALAGRERGRSRMRLVTVGLGGAALATAGVVAYHLPGPAHKTAATTTTTVTPSSQPTAATHTSYSGDDGGSSSVTAGTGAGTTHTTSGGS
jgi:hypothetical protein